MKRFVSVMMVVMMVGVLHAGTVRVGIYENPPKYFSDQAGKASGFFGELFEYVAKANHWQVTYVPCTWDECMAKTADGRLDLMLDVAYSDERAKRFDFNTQIILSDWVVLYANKNVHVDSVRDLDGKKIALLKGSIQEKFLSDLAKKFGISLRFVYVDSFQASFELADGSAADVAAVNDFFGKSAAPGYYLYKSGITFAPDTLHAVTRKGSNHELLQGIDRVVSELKGNKESYYYALQSHWLHTPEYDRPKKLVLSPAEKSWLKNNPTVRVGIHADRAPLEHVDADGKAGGILVRLLELVGKKTGTTFRFVAADSFADLDTMLKAGKIDAIATPSRSHLASQMNHVVMDRSFSIVVYNLKNVPGIGDLSALTGKKVALLSEGSLWKTLGEQYPGIDFIKVKNYDEAIKSLHAGRIDAFVGNQVVVNHLLHLKGINDIKIAVSTTLECEPWLGIRPDWPEFSRITRKVLAAIPQTAKAVIRHELIGKQHKQAIDYTLLWQIGGGALLLMIGLFFWNRRLEEEIRVRKAAETRLRETLETLRVTQSQLIQQSRLDSLTDLISNIAHHWRQPLNMLALYISDLKEAKAFNEMDDAYLEDFHKKSQKTIDEMSRMIDGFREFYIKEETWQPFAVKEAVNRAVEMMDAIFETIGVRVEIVVHDDVSVMGHPNEFTQVLLTILQNALDRLIQVEGPRKVRISVKKTENGDAQVTLYNNGSPIDKSIIGRIFEPYFTTKFKSQGVGTSLFMAKMVIEKRMGGEIRVGNRDGGVLFTIGLPLSVSA